MQHTLAMSPSPKIHRWLYLLTKSTHAASSTHDFQSTTIAAYAFFATSLISACDFPSAFAIFIALVRARHAAFLRSHLPSFGTFFFRRRSFLRFLRGSLVFRRCLRSFLRCSLGCRRWLRSFLRGSLGLRRCPRTFWQRSTNCTARSSQRNFTSNTKFVVDLQLEHQCVYVFSWAVIRQA